ncbi:RusA family crossover junction endodeoxyribonuclease [Brachybacterium alimentarium]|uniref:RusA family crossover junction endodeoxyribonuclease n=1 Tax=Brachybacterium alimentarium TaxID=47845 RepID=UPI000DF161EA|nr:RusA family crossover junction endodeoxyribonuclease [Brachybacterium alimentarium]RCS81840.1 RusA family crossover junction endodeoxyribonuclease [Brachybacterium alimentarium]
MSNFPIWIPGTPIPQGSKSAGKRGKTVVMWDANRNLKPWRQTMTAHLAAWTALSAGAWEPFDGPLIVDATFWIPRPARPKFTLPATPADLDKYQRALGDSMTDSGLIKDDARITTWHARKRYAEPGREGITIHDIRTDTTPAPSIAPGSCCPECGHYDPEDKEDTDGTHAHVEA